MNDALKASGIVGGGGVAVSLVMLAYRVVNDQTLTYSVVGGVLVLLGLWLIGIDFRRMREAMEARAAVLRLQNESSLIGARTMRTMDGVSVVAPGVWPGSDQLGTMIAGMPAADVIDGAPHQVGWDKGD